ncbi:hypothetical protein M409DRAFT_22100 [Zasmidium cellare ATCC 36951]|uniref:ASST-domain-containing protein n=1 Tax=Zasmidium cellare ATCC 36951 TaxID=1080233 RepID=A0A6A6CLD9_ZASCE|nr:uncharacterized protein M409DRAFT_22100 [Zasmidium cellare ATCC 36951]KAF2167955.1 hypothetical protein M409DRAFT_22100 [Zasmidium cellare ATCC 36951]
MAWIKHVRSAIKLILVVLAVLLSLFLVHQCFLPILAFVFPSLGSTFFDLGVYGLYPTQQYISFDLLGPQARRVRWDDRCDNGYLLMTPNGPSVERPGPMMLDAKGELVWMSDDFGATANLKVQRYKGEDYLTLWSGEKAATSGKGVYFMIDSTYQVVRMVSAMGKDLFGDLHEFKITESGTALLSIYNTTTADLRGMGRGRGANGWIVDNLFQEIDLETGELLFQWSAAANFNPMETYMTNPFGGYWESIPFDFYHLNSIDKDSQGNYLISSRHFHHVTCISPAGEILWILGGRDNQFEDLSEGRATDFRWQHDARWVSEEEGILTLFDNQKAGPLHSDAAASRAMFIKLDIPNRTAELVQSMESLQGILASSQGSVQVLPDSEHTFVGWGSAAAYSEYDQAGEMLCETHLGASWFYWFERFKSYRTTKTFTWRGNPKSPPQAKIEDASLFVSWNGATEVAYWALEASRDEASSEIAVGAQTEDLRSQRWENIDIIPKAGFEGAFDLPSLPSSERPFTHYRVAALDKEHAILRYSDPIGYDEDSTESSTLMILFKLFLVVGILAGVPLMFKFYRSGQSFRSWSNTQKPVWADWTPPSSYLRRAHRSVPSEWIKMKWTGARRPR